MGEGYTPVREHAHTRAYGLVRAFVRAHLVVFAFYGVLCAGAHVRVCLHISSPPSAGKVHACVSE